MDAIVHDVGVNVIFDGDEHQRFACPVCKDGYQHQAGAPRHYTSPDDYACPWWGKGDLIVIEFHGECGSWWTLNMGFHKGDTFVFARIDKPCTKR